MCIGPIDTIIYNMSRRIDTISGETYKSQQSVANNWSDIGPQTPENYDPHDPTTFINPYSGIHPFYTPEQLQTHIEAGKEQLNQQWKILELWYNSEEQKYKRLRSVGINPQLTGLGDASETNASATPSTPSEVGSIAAQSVQNSIQRRQQVGQFLLSAASLVINTVSSLINVGLGIATTAATVTAQTALAAKYKAEEDAIKTAQNAQLLQSDLDLEERSYELAKKSAFNDITQGRKPNMTPQQLSQLIKFDGTYSSNSRINQAIRRHKKDLVGNLELVSDYNDSLADSQRTNAVAGFFAPYNVTYSSVADKMQPFAYYAYNFRLSELKLQNRINIAKKAYVDGINPELCAKMINAQSYRQMAENGYFTKYFKSANGSLAGDLLNSQNQFNKDYYDNADGSVAGQLFTQNAENDFFVAFNSQEFLSNELINRAIQSEMQVNHSTFMYNLQNIHIKTLEESMNDIRKGKFNPFRPFQVNLQQMVIDNLQGGMNDIMQSSMNYTGGWTGSDVASGVFDAAKSVGSAALAGYGLKMF